MYVARLAAVQVEKAYLQRSDKVGSLEKSQLADLVDNGGDLGAGSGGLCRLVPPLCERN